MPSRRTPVSWPIRALLVAFLAPIAACSTGDPAPGTVVRDSAGVTIVENSARGRVARESWRLPADPLVRIGTVDGPDEYQLFRALSAVRLDDGRIVVANGGTNELRFYDDRGRFLMAAGRPGEGPGEFRDLQRVWRLPGDSLLAYDFMPARLSLFAGDGRYVHVVHVRSPEGRQVIVHGPLADGSLIVTGAPILDSESAAEGVVRDSVPLDRYGADGTHERTLARVPSAEAMRIATDAGWRWTSPPFPRISLTAVSGDRVVFGPADAYELQVYDAEGSLERLIRLAGTERPVTAEDMARFRRERLAAAQEPASRVIAERMLRAVPMPESMPPYHRLLADREGHVWVADYRPDRTDPWHWRVFAPSGEYVADVSVPAALELFEVGGDYVLGRWRDDLEVETIRLYRLEKP